VARAQPIRPTAKLRHTVGPSERMQPQQRMRARCRRPQLTGLCRHRGRLDRGNPGQFGFGHPGRSAHHGQRLRRPHVIAARDVDEAEDFVRGRIVDRSSRAAPRLYESVEVLCRLDLDRRIQVESRSRRVRSGVQFVPDGALDEVDRVSAAKDVGRTAHPQQLAVGVSDSHHAVAVDRGSSEHVVQQREHPGQRMGRPVLDKVRRAEQHGSEVRVGVDPGCRRPDPRLGHDTANAHRRLPRLQVGVALVVPKARLPVAASHRPSQAGGTPTAKGYPPATAPLTSSSNSPTPLLASRAFGAARSGARPPSRTG
jgi:hypothetical protein